MNKIKWGANRALLCVSEGKSKTLTLTRDAKFLVAPDTSVSTGRLMLYLEIN